MQVSFVTPGQTGSGALVVGVLDGGAMTPTAAKADKETGGALKRAMGASRFRGKRAQVLELLAPHGTKASRIILAGLGKAEAFDSNAVERVAAAVIGRLLASGEKKVTFAIDVPKRAKVSAPALAAHLAFGASLTSYRFDIYRKVKDDEQPSLKELIVETKAAAAARKLWDGLSALSEGVYLARDLVNEPANVLYPGRIRASREGADQARRESGCVGRAGNEKARHERIAGCGAGKRA